MKKVSTREAARKLGLSFPTLNRYIAAGKIAVPPVQELGGGKFRLWSEGDIEKVRKILPKIANGRKTRYQKERAKKKGSKRASKKK
jgi:predicted site-specific integrase-resolvase